MDAEYLIVILIVILIIDFAGVAASRRGRQECPLSFIQFLIPNS